MTYRALALSLATVLLTSTVVFAQPSNPVSNPRYYGPDVTTRRMAPPEAVHSHSSTALEGALRGRAVLRSATGDLLLDMSKARVINQHALSLHFDNDLKKTQTALLKKQMKAEYRELERERKRLRRQNAHYERELAEARKSRLDEFQFNWATGRVYWPASVASPRYAAYRQEIDKLMDQVVRYRLAGDATYREEIATVCEKFRRQLREDTKQDRLRAESEYQAMKQFLQGIKYAPYFLAELPTENSLSVSMR